MRGAHKAARTLAKTIGATYANPVMVYYHYHATTQRTWVVGAYSADGEQVQPITLIAQIDA